MRRERFDDDCDAHRDWLAVLNVERWEGHDRLRELMNRARKHFPDSRHLRHGWVRARLALGNKRPKVHIGSGAPLRFPRTMREAVFL